MIDDYEFAALLGHVIVSVTGAYKGSDEIRFGLSDGRTARLYHAQDCCESVAVEDVAGDVADLVGSPVLIAEESSGDRPADVPAPDYVESETWTFYRIGTVKGTVVIRWLGQSNGYYSETAAFYIDNRAGGR
jgi:hypothetical protein